jgi:succinoglycan biosynthesis transport protein ExoP
MEEAIDLRYYVEVVLKYWKWIAVLTVVAMVASALVTTRLLPPSYRATATVVVVSPKYQVVFDSPIESVDAGGSATIYGSMAKSAYLTAQIIEQLGGALPAGLRTPRGLNRLLTASFSRTSDLIELEVRHSDPQVAADVANAWAAVFVQQINDLYSQSAGDVQQLEQQIESAGLKLQTAEQALLEFQRTNPSAVLTETISVQSEALADYMRAETNLDLALQDALSLKAQLQAADSASPTLSSNLAMLLTELNALGAHRALGAPIQISLDASSLANVDPSQQIQHLDNLIAALQAKKVAYAAARDQVPHKILEAQHELQRAQGEMNRLMDTRDVAREAHLILLRKAEELRIATQVNPSEMRVASPADVPGNPLPASTVLNVAAAGIVALLVGCLGALVWEYLRKPFPAPREG